MGTDILYYQIPIKAAAGTATRITIRPTGGETWILDAAEGIKFMPNATTTANGTNYATIRAYKADTAITDARTTASTDLTQGTVDAQTVSGTGLNLEFTAAAPFNFRVTHAASGAAVDGMVILNLRRA